MTSFLLRIASAVFACVIFCLSARADEDGVPGKYVPIPFDGDLQKALLERLQQARDQEDVRRYVLEQIQSLKKTLPRNFDWWQFDPNTMRSDLTMEKAREVLKAIQGQHPASKYAILDLKQLPSLEDLVGARSKVNGGPADALPQEPPDFSAPAEFDAADQPKDLAGWLRDLMEGVEDSGMGEMLRDSPAWQQGLRGLQNVLQGQGGKNWNVPDWIKRIDLKWNGRLPTNALERLSSVSLPSWAKPNLSLPRINMPRLSWGGPRVSMPGMPGMPGANAAWLLLILTSAGVGLYLAWYLMKHYQPRAVSGPAYVLGPWPVSPDRISTRAELVQAFDYLSLLLLGPQVRSWNHRAIARRLAKDNSLEATRAAQRLALMYEDARYAPDDRDLDADTRLLARHDLCLLAGLTV